MQPSTVSEAVAAKVQQGAHAANAADHSLEKASYEVSKEANKSVMHNSNVPLGDRMDAGVNALKDKLHAGSAEAKKDAELKAAGLSTDGHGHPIAGQASVAKTVEEGRHAAKAMEAKAEETTEHSKYEYNKSVALDSNAGLLDRASAAMGAVSSAWNESSATAKKEAEKKAAGINDF